MLYSKLFIGFIFSLLSFSCVSQNPKNSNYKKASETINAIYSHYSVSETNLLRETYPFDDKRKATYLSDEAQAQQSNPYSYLWPYSGSLSAITALCRSNNTPENSTILNEKVLPGLEMYFDTHRTPYGYSSYIISAPQSDRFYDDNVWLGIDFTDLYELTKEAQFLEKAKLIWNFVKSGQDSLLGGGIYWCEQKKTSKNTCSNAPGSVFALKLFTVTNDRSYLEKGIALYNWTKNNLQDKEDFLYFDNINLKGEVDKRKYAYNSGQMLQASVLLYELTKDKKYLTEAQQIAKSCYNHFFSEDTDGFKRIKNGDIWFTAVMFRGFLELYKIDKNDEYIKSFQKNLNYAWENMRDENGLFNTDWNGVKKDKTKWLLAQFAMVEMYAGLSVH